uniref:Uncharacterized protein n=1 Tax=Siphoviridae sp. cteoh1 TaxID=2826407 RepID=A0A8S5QMG2_9CAUD|nr:MAG TPA: hypothetical protein [Siphoviridae sp. cteoh1]DAJ89124.1 MAG TPA: hypothetical protein [Caudoviricetes sp.]DAJ92035.1 MAG TPA: hypothetical protein [Caudoviricetes sp.]
MGLCQKRRKHHKFLISKCNYIFIERRIYQANILKVYWITYECFFNHYAN